MDLIVCRRLSGEISTELLETGIFDVVLKNGGCSNDQIQLRKNVGVFLNDPLPHLRCRLQFPTLVVETPVHFFKEVEAPPAIE